MKSILFLLLLLPVITACGFHLRGSQTDAGSEIEQLYLQTAGATGIADEVRSQLQASETTILNSSEGAELTLNLANQSLAKTVLSVSSVTGKVEGFQLTLSVLLSVFDAEKNELISNQTIRVTRDYTFDENAVLGTVNEEKALTEELTRQAATQIIRHLNAVTRD